MTAAQAFGRPGWLVRLNLVAAVLFLIPSLLDFANQRPVLGVLWLAIAGFWLRRFRWARRSPFLEITGEELVMHLGPGRSRSLALAEVADLEAGDSELVIRLGDGSTARFAASDLAPGELPRLAELLVTRMTRTAGGEAPAPAAESG